MPATQEFKAPRQQSAVKDYISNGTVKFMALRRLAIKQEER
jgi:hypothetical protein